MVNKSVKTKVLKINVVAKEKYQKNTLEDYQNVIVLNKVNI